MELLEVKTVTNRREFRVRDYYSVNFELPDFCKNKSPDDIVRVEVYGYTVTATLRKPPSEPMPKTFTLSNGDVLRCIQCDMNGIVTATAYIPV